MALYTRNVRPHTLVAEGLTLGKKHLFSQHVHKDRSRIYFWLLMRHSNGCVTRQEAPFFQHLREKHLVFNICKNIGAEYIACCYCVTLMRACFTRQEAPLSRSYWRWCPHEACRQYGIVVCERDNNINTERQRDRERQKTVSHEIRRQYGIAVRERERAERDCFSFGCLNVCAFQRH